MDSHNDETIEDIKYCYICNKVSCTPLTEQYWQRYCRNCLKNICFSHIILDYGDYDSYGICSKCYEENNESLK